MFIPVGHGQNLIRLMLDILPGLRPFLYVANAIEPPPVENRLMFGIYRLRSLVEGIMGIISFRD